MSSTALLRTAAGEEQVAQGGEERSLEIRASLELLLLVDRLQNSLLHEILSLMHILGERDCVGALRGQAAHELVKKGLVHRFRVSPDDLSHASEKLGQAPGHLSCVGIAVESAQLAPEMGLDGVGAGRELGEVGASVRGALGHRPLAAPGWGGFNRGRRPRERRSPVPKSVAGP